MHISHAVTLHLISHNVPRGIAFQLSKKYHSLLSENNTWEAKKYLPVVSLSVAKGSKVKNKSIYLVFCKSSGILHWFSLWSDLSQTIFAEGFGGRVTSDLTTKLVFAGPLFLQENVVFLSRDK